MSVFLLIAHITCLYVTIEMESHSLLYETISWKLTHDGFILAHSTVLETHKFIIIVVSQHWRAAVDIRGSALPSAEKSRKRVIISSRCLSVSIGF